MLARLNFRLKMKVKKLGPCQAHGTGRGGGNLWVRLGVLLQRGNAAILANRIPSLPSPNVDGVLSFTICQFFKMVTSGYPCTIDTRGREQSCAEAEHYKLIELISGHYKMCNFSNNDT